MPFSLRFRGWTLIQFPDPLVDISWISDFWASVRDYVFVRQEDKVVILPPNLVYKTNSTGIATLEWLNSGKSLLEIPGIDGSRMRDIVAFLKDIRDACDGKSVSTESVPYDFDFTRLPVLGEIAVTYACNNRCLFCYAGCGTGSRGDAGMEMDMKSLKRVVDIFRDEAKIPFFSLTGGEPLLRQDLEELISYAGSRKLRVNLITNGTLATKERAESLYGSGLRTAQVSLESPNPAIHDALCAIDGSHARTLEGIASLQAAGIAVQTNSTVTRMNRESLLGMPAFLKTLGIRRFSMNLYIPASNMDRAPELFISYTEIGRFIDQVRSKAMQEGLTFYWYSPTPLCLYNPVARGLGNKNCAAADGLVSVNPGGFILPCSSYNEPLGNILAEKFSDIWFSARAAHFKKKHYAPESCKACTAFVACQAACPLYWDYAGYGELEKAR
jgi:radical SAM protein with 4Fe4S-binding SPASM domain